jgi:excisionase family DNA binding protein
MVELLTVQELANYLKLNPVTVIRKAKSGELPCMKVGRQFRFDKQQIDEWLVTNSVNKTGNILVVDDEVKICDLFKDALTSSGYMVDTAQTGEAALKLIDKKNYHLIFLDLAMPKMDGSVVFQKIRAKIEDVPIIIITGYPDSDLLNDMLQAEPLLVLKKPFNIDSLLKMVNKMI